MITLVDAAREFGIALTLEQQQAFDDYYRELIVWNARMNLTAITEHDQVVVKHFLDSLSVAPILQRVIASRGAARQSPDTNIEIASSHKSLLATLAPHVTVPELRHSHAGVTESVRLIDIGTGAGFPSIPLKIALPDMRLTLLEATGKKVEFLKHMIEQLHLQDTVAIQARAEDLGRDVHHREQYDVAIARAVANLAILLEYALPFVRQGGFFIAQKGVNVDDEMRQAERAMRVLGGRVREIIPVKLPGLEQRHLIVVEKIAATPASFPRRAGIPERQPLTN